jgi:hypothetical protein
MLDRHQEGIPWRIGILGEEPGAREGRSFSANSEIHARRAGIHRSSGCRQVHWRFENNGREIATATLGAKTGKSASNDYEKLWAAGVIDFALVLFVSSHASLFRISLAQ